MNYYNEHDPKAAAWLRELIAAGLIPAGHVDERSIVDVQPDDVRGYMQCHWFAGIGGWSEALRLAGWPSERPVWTGSCPCQPYSVAGKQAGNADARDLWPAFARLIRECKPPTVFGEQVEGAVRHGWLDRVCGDLEAEGYAVGAHVLGAHSVGAPHIRQRLYWLADGERRRCREAGISSCVDGIQGQPQDLPMQTSQRGPHSRLADSSQGLEERPEQPAREELQAAQRGGVAGGMGHTPSEGPLPSTHLGIHCGEESARARDGEFERSGSTERVGHAEIHGRGQGIEDAGGMRSRDSEEGQVGRPAITSNAWSKFDILPCLDGKARRVESGVFPLAHGASGRVGLLRGYGNAIVPQVAAEFVKAFMETES